jgi:hypothetical protein
VLSKFEIKKSLMGMPEWRTRIREALSSFAEVLQHGHKNREYYIPVIAINGFNDK